MRREFVVTRRDAAITKRPLSVNTVKPSFGSETGAFEPIAGPRIDQPRQFPGRLGLEPRTDNV